jgi:uncharacterized membrane protein
MVEPAKPSRFVTTAATVGVIAAGVALFEVALIPGMIIGGAAVLAPRCLPKLRRRLKPNSNPASRRRVESTSPLPVRQDIKPTQAIAKRFAIRQAVAKTITFRVILTTLDFTTNYLVIGELGTAAGLSTFALVAGPLFYLAHETAWNYFGASVEGKAGRWGPAVTVPLSVTSRPDTKTPLVGRGGFTINRALAKTITFRTIATTMDFTTTYVVVGDLVTAATLSAFGFVIGPFVYLGHEMAWDYYGSRTATPDSPMPKTIVVVPT